MLYALFSLYSSLLYEVTYLQTYRANTRGPGGPKNSKQNLYDRALKILYTGCPKKNAILCLMGHRGHQEWTRDKSRVSFENLRKFPFWWAQKLPIFDKKWVRKMRSKMPTPPVKMAWLWITSKMFFFCSYFNEKIFWSSHSDNIIVLEYHGSH